MHFLTHGDMFKFFLGGTKNPIEATIPHPLQVKPPNKPPRHNGHPKLVP